MSVCGKRAHTFIIKGGLPPQITFLNIRGSPNETDTACASCSVKDSSCSRTAKVVEFLCRECPPLKFAIIRTCWGLLSSPIPMVENQRKCQRKRMLKPGICTLLCQELPAPPTNNVLLSSAICNNYSFRISFLTENDRLCMWCLCLTFGMKSYTTPGPTKNGQSLPAPHKALLNNRLSQKRKCSVTRFPRSI